MHFNPSISVVINNKQLQTVAAVSVQNDSSHIGSDADIIVPLNCRIQYQDGAHDYLTDLPKNLFKVGDFVKITAQYEGYNTVNVFEGYVLDFIEGTPVKIKCSDYVYLLNQSTINVSHKTITLKDLITEVLKGTGIELLLPTFELTLKNITFRLMSPAAILEWLKKELGINISLSGKKLYVNVASNTLNVVKYSTDRNVIESGLQTPAAVFLKYKVKAWFIKEDGTKDSFEVGDKDGHLHEVFFYRVPRDQKIYEKMANEALEKVKQHSYSGEITTYLYPDCQLFDKAVYTDVRYPAKNGNYVIIAVHFDINENGYHRKLKFAHLSTLNEQTN